MLPRLDSVAACMIINLAWQQGAWTWTEGSFREQLRIAARPISHHSTLGHRDANIVGRQL
jgi:hypothetical protein